LLKYQSTVYVFLMCFCSLLLHHQAFTKTSYGSTVFDAFISDLFDVMNNPNCPLFADNLKISELLHNERLHF
jgi:hypothetical protein